MNFIFPLLYFILSNGFIVYITKKSFGKCLPLTIMLNAFVYFFSQVIFSTFKVGFYFNLVLALLFIIILIIEKIKNKNFDEFKNNFFSNGFIAFVTIYLIVYILDFNRTFGSWDEFSHWGVMIKEMLRLDQFYSVDASALQAHKDYPPIVQLFELFYCNLSGGYKETYLIRAVHLFTFSLFIPFISDKCKESKIKMVIRSIALMVISFFTILLLDQHAIINAIYTDYIMAIVVAYLLAIIVFEENTLSKFNLVRLSIASSFLLMTKQMGLPLYLMVIFMYFVDILVKNKFDVKILFNKKIILSIIMLIVIPMSFWKGWSIYVDSLHLEQQFKISDLKISELYGIVRGQNGEQWQKDAAINYIKELKTTSMTTSNLISLTYYQCLALVLLLLYLISIYGKKIFYKGQMSIIALTLTLGFIGYGFVMLVMYTFSFGPTEGPSLASFNRYMPTYVLICLSLIVMMFSYIDSLKSNKCDTPKNILILMCIMFLIQNPFQTQTIFPKLKLNPDNEFKYHADNISSKTKNNSKIYIIAQNSSGNYQFFVKYYMNPRITNLHYFNLPTDNVKNYKKYFDKDIKEYMLEYDYLYLINVDDNFIQKYNFIFPSNDIKSEQLYKIRKVNDNIKLEIVN